MMQKERSLLTMAVQSGLNPSRAGMVDPAGLPVERVDAQAKACKARSRQGWCGSSGNPKNGSGVILTPLTCNRRQGSTPSGIFHGSLCWFPRRLWSLNRCLAIFLWPPAKPVDGEGIGEADWKAMMEHKTTILLSPKDWEWFCALLKAPPQPEISPDE